MLKAQLRLKTQADGQPVLAGDGSGCRTAHPRAYCLAAMATNAERPDETLMLEYRAGDVAAFDELYRRHKSGLYRYLLRQCRDAAAAAEMFQDVWMNLIRVRARYEPTARFATYLYRLAHNRLVDHYRKHARGATVSFDDNEIEERPVSTHEQPELHHERKVLALRVLTLLDSLPAEQREAFVLQYESGMTVEEIATVTGVNRETAKSRLRYALAKLRAGLSEWQ